MGKFTDKLRSMFGRSRPIPKEDAGEIDDWVNEGGAADPEGPPRVISDQRDDDQRDDEQGHETQH